MDLNREEEQRYRYTIEYHYGSYSGIYKVIAGFEEDPIAKMWGQFRRIGLLTRPINFNDEMVRAILENRKSQTRRVVKLPEGDWATISGGSDFGDGSGVWQIESPRLKYGRVVDAIKCPYGKPGDLLWCRETYMQYDDGEVVYRADCELERGVQYDKAGRYQPWPWRPPIFMPKSASRITLEITGVRVERVRDITEGGCFEEGVIPDGWNGSPFEPFRKLWDGINGKKPGCSWAENPFCWIIEFKRLEQAK